MHFVWLVVFSVLRSVEIPLDESAATAEFGLHLDVKVRVPIANALRKVAVAIDKQQAKLAGGKRITEPSQAALWVAANERERTCMIAYQSETVRADFGGLLT